MPVVQHFHSRKIKLNLNKIKTQFKLGKWLGEQFKAFDYGTVENLHRYGEPSPPSYNLSLVTVPIRIFWAQNDRLTPPQVHNSNKLMNHVKHHNRFDVYRTSNGYQNNWVTSSRLCLSNGQNLII